MFFRARSVWGLLRALLLAVMLAVMLGCDRPPPLPLSSEYAIAQLSPFNQPGYLPLEQPVDPRWYRPVAEWEGRLILPPQDEAGELDWVWFEVWQSPQQELMGQRLRLEWGNDPTLQAIARTVTATVQFTPAAVASERAGNVHPSRLNGRRVGPLRSLAGARPQDDVVVALEQVQVAQANGSPILRINAEPTQIPGRFVALAVLEQPLDPPGLPLPIACPGDPPCPSGVFRIRHYNPATGRFDGLQEEVWIPQVLPGRDAVFQSTPRGLEQSPAGRAGWYLYGAKNRDGMFVVQAIAPRALFQLTPDQVYRGKADGLHYLKQLNWRHPEAHKGNGRSVLLTQAEGADWQVGDRAVVMHLFGGIGGRKAEPAPLGTVTGHFSYGIATVARDPFTGERQFQIRYHQVYAHNPDGIVSGLVSWAEYLGNLQRGWLGTRPVSDVLIRFDPVLQDYTFGEGDGRVVLSPLGELQRQLQIMTARYRIGDGTGAAVVNPAQSCVQDSNQALFLTMRRLEQQVRETPAIQSWVRSHPDHPQTRRFQQLLALQRDLERQLVPLGVVRPDWNQNIRVLAGIQPLAQADFTQRTNLWTQITSWRTMVPRVAHDQLASLLLEQGSTLWVLRTDQVGGQDADIQPLAATQLLERFFIIPNSFSRLIESCRWPDGRGWAVAIAALGGYALVAIPLGFRYHFLRRDTAVLRQLSPQQRFGFGLRHLVFPALLEELVFRVMLVPHPSEGVAPLLWLAWAALSLLLFVLYHPLNALTVYKAGKPTFLRPIFLGLAALLGGVCTAVYGWTGSLWAIALIHWGVVMVWLLALGGLAHLGQHHPVAR